ncbi:MAG: CDP-alcohol phosphatidyltransferase family protein [Acidobacteriota bacterium]
MPSVYDLKPRFQALLRPLLGRLAAAGVRANHVTVLALAGSGAAGALLALHPAPAALLVLPAWLPARMALNAIDGMLAREFRQASTLGAVLNELGDVLSDLALALPLAVRAPEAGVAVVAFAVGGALTEFSGVLGQALGASRRYDGPMGKSDRALLLGALGLATFVRPGVLPAWPAVFWAAAALTGVTCFLRLRRALAELPARATAPGGPA